jgi:hypothetical protein
MSDAIAMNPELGRPPLALAMARHPWRWFFAIALIPTVVVGLPDSFSLFSEVNTGGFAVLAAVLVAWAGDAGEKTEPRGGRRLAVFLAVLVAWSALTWWSGRGTLGLVLGLPSAIFTAFALAAIYSPTAALRDLARPLLRQRAPWTTYAVALLAWPLLAGVAILISRLGTTAPVQDFGGGPSWHSDIGSEVLAYAIVTAVPVAIAWYGFAAHRLARRFSPLLVAALVGPPAWLAILLPLSLRWGDFAPFATRTLLSEFAVAIVAVWVYQRSAGSLLPVAVVLTGAYTAPSIVYFWSGPRFAMGNGLNYLIAGLECLLALGLAVQGRMWRTPEPEPRPAAA